MVKYIFLLILAYIIGSIPSGYWFSKFFFDIDITRAGSKNIGATNVARLLGKKYFLLIFFIDFFKAFIFLFLLNYLGVKTDFLFFVAILILIGNSFSIFLRFKGGKGVATSLGLLMALYPINLIFAFISFWICLFLFFKRVDIASLSSFLFICFFSLFSFHIFSYHFLFLLFFAIWVWLRHFENLKNLIKIIRG